MPFDELPDCASQCGPLYDADGACAPFAGQRLNQDAWDRCFCAFGSLQPWTTGISRVCDGACAEPTDLLSIRDWFSSECEEIVQFQTLGPLTTSTVPPGVTTVTVTPTARPVSGGSQAATGNGGGGDWYVP